MKKNIIIILVILVIIGGIGTFLLLPDKKSETYHGIGTVISSLFEEATVEIKENDKVIGTALVYSNIFREEDNLKVEYTKNGKKIEITKIGLVNDTEEEKTNIIQNIKIDMTIRRYCNMMSGTIDISEKSGSFGAIMNLNNINALPEKISNQHYNLTNLIEYFRKENVGESGIFIPIEKGLLTTIKLTSNFKILSFENIADNMSKTNVTYTLNDKNISFNGLGLGIYSLRLEFENGDIINYLFK